ncbi:MAG: MoaD/ThiS family protein [Coriobacteriales bacterium]|jgi:hypothetical protein
MQITFKFYNPEVFSGMENGPREITEGATIAQAMEELYEREEGITSERYLDFVIFLLNKAPAHPGSPLFDGDEVLVLRKSYGG